MPARIYPYIECPFCGFIECDPRDKLLSTALPCKKCAKFGAPKPRWPSVFGYQWMDIIRAYKIEKMEDKNLLSVMLCATTELLMEELLTRILYVQGVRKADGENIIAEHQGQSRQKDLFKKICGRPLKNALTELQFRQFYDAWERIVQKRNMFAHGQPPGVEPVNISDEKDFESDLKAMRNGILESFYRLHNRFAVATPR